MKTLLELSKFLSKVIGVIWFCFWVLGIIIAFYPEGMYGLTVFSIIISAVGLVPFFVFREPRPKPVAEQLAEIAFNIDKHIKVNRYSDFYVDDINKRFAVRVKKYFRVVDYVDLVTFERAVSTRRFISGRDNAFGTWKGEEYEVWDSVSMYITINNLDDPQIVMPNIWPHEQADVLSATLTYIKNNTYTF
jgi:hypothetical protein